MKSLLILAFILAVALILIDAYNLRKRSNRFKREDDNDTEIEDQPEYVLNCYREGKQCCESFQEWCHGNSDCESNEVCCFANCTVQCYPVDKLGKIPDKALDEANRDENDVLETDPDYIRYPTKAKINKNGVKRPACYPKNETCCYYYIEECHDNSDCEENETCCEEECGSMCYPSEKVGERIFPDDPPMDLTDEDDDDSSWIPDVISAMKKEDGSLVINVKPRMK
jgi:hypothetical protein